jgi:hypothetical protein
MNGCTTKVVANLAAMFYFFLDVLPGLVFSLTVFAKLRTQRKPI